MRDADGDVLAAILRELVGLRADLAAARPAAPHDDAAGADLLRAIVAAVADRLFSAGDLLIHARLPAAAPLHAAIIAAIGTANARRLGKALARCEGADLDGLRVVRVDSDSTGIIWNVRRV